jgi:hypothetical protein
MVAAREAIERQYAWSYQAVPGEPRWSARAPIGDWWSNHRAAQHSVRDQARWARELASQDSARILVPTPLPFRYELEILLRGEPYAYHSHVDPGALWFELVSGGSTYLFLEGGPEATQQAIDRAARAGELAGYSVWIPPDSRPTKPFVLPTGMREVALDDLGQRPAP